MEKPTPEIDEAFVHYTERAAALALAMLMLRLNVALPNLQRAACDTECK